MKKICSIILIVLISITTNQKFSYASSAITETEYLTMAIFGSTSSQYIHYNMYAERNNLLYINNSSMHNNLQNIIANKKNVPTHQINFKESSEDSSIQIKNWQICIENLKQSDDKKISQLIQLQTQEARKQPDEVLESLLLSIKEGKQDVE